MREKVYHYVASVIFFIIAIFHLARIVYDWQAVMGGVVIPMWVSWAAVIIAGYLFVRGWMFAKAAK